MKTKRLLLVCVVGIFAISAAAPSAWAGSAQRYRWEGVAIGVGAAIVGSALLAQYASPRYERTTVYENVYYTPPRRHHRHHWRRWHHRRHGYWESRRVWVPPVYERTWNPGHYNHRRCWVPGHWIRILKSEGYFTHERVWVTRRDGGNRYRDYD